ncbi:MAG: hypothetical protein CUN54_08895 [Phototrophicales bacterium]|nr:MAG: hypothetical protein CUN54_08895 [Phototrophicales bacterium]
MVMLSSILLFVPSAAQDNPTENGSVDVLVTWNRNLLTVFVPEPEVGVVSLLGLEFQISEGDETTTYNISRFPILEDSMLSNIAKATCFQFIREDSAVTPLLDCIDSQMFDVMLQDADVFWYDEVVDARRNVTVLLPDGTQKLCANSISRCEFQVAVTQRTMPVEQTEPRSVITATPFPTVQPCTISTQLPGVVRVHVGPGRNRTVLGYLEADRDFVVLARSVANDDSTWFQLDRNEAMPHSTVPRDVWVAAIDVTASGNCDRVSPSNPPAPPPGVAATPFPFVPGQQVVVTENQSAVRSGPGISHAIIVSVDPEDYNERLVLRINGMPEIAPVSRMDNGWWWPVTIEFLESGQIEFGWVSQAVLRPL